MNGAHHTPSWTHNITHTSHHNLSSPTVQSTRWLIQKQNAWIRYLQQHFSSHNFESIMCSQETRESRGDIQAQHRWWVALLPQLKDLHLQLTLPVCLLCRWAPVDSKPVIEAEKLHLASDAMFCYVWFYKEDAVLTSWMNNRRVEEEVPFGRRSEPLNSRDSRTLIKGVWMSFCSTYLCTQYWKLHSNICIHCPSLLSPP